MQLVDKPIVLATWSATITLIILSIIICLKNFSRTIINYLLFVFILQSVYLLDFLTNAPTFGQLIHWLFLRVFDGTNQR